ncbi:MAG TPA: universal stress protein [Thermoleophilaceae bacterium]
MGKPILVGYDPRTIDNAPLSFGIAAARFTGARLIVACVTSEKVPSLPVSGEPLDYAVGQTDADLTHDASEAARAVQQHLEHEGIAYEVRLLQSSSAAKALHREADDDDAGLLVIGSSRRSGVGRALAGGTAVRLLHGAPCPVTVVPRAWTRGGPPSVIGVAYVDTEEAREALRGAYALARRAGATLRVITVVKVTASMHFETEPATASQAGKSLEEVEGEHRLEAERRLRVAVGELGDDVSVEVEAVIGDPGEALVELSNGVDLLVCGSRGYGPARAVLLGSVSRHVVSEAHCPVIVLPRGVKASLEALVTEESGAGAPA